MYPLTVSIDLSIFQPVPYHCFENAVTFALENHIRQFVEMHNQRFMKAGYVDNPIACNMLNSCNICYLNKHLLRVGQTDES